jgi:hypothetical protein
MVNLNLSKPEEPVMYLGVENTIMIQGAYQGKNLQLESRRGKLVMQAGTSIRGTITYQHLDTDTIRFYADSVLVSEKIYRVDTLCAPSIALRTISKNQITTDELLKAAKLEAVFPSCIYRWRGRVSKWSYQVYRKGKALGEEVHSQLNAFDKETRAYFETLKPGDEIQFNVSEITNAANTFKPTSKRYTIKAKE